ncbi:hypothetical protein Tco_1296232, partial [Tanacetum coccineum]
YGYIKNHNKTVKNGQARTRESEEYKKEAKESKPKPGKVKPSVKVIQLNYPTQLKKEKGAKALVTVHLLLRDLPWIKREGFLKLRAKNVYSSKLKYNGRVIKVKSRESLALDQAHATSIMEKAQIHMGFCAKTLTKEAQ